MRQGYSFGVRTNDGPIDIDVQLTDAEMRKAADLLNNLMAADRIRDWEVTEYPEKGLTAFRERLRGVVDF